MMRCGLNTLEVAAIPAEIPLTHKGDFVATFSSAGKLMDVLSKEHVVDDFSKCVVQGLACQDEADGKSDQQSYDKYAHWLRGQTEHLSNRVAELLRDDMGHDDYYPVEKFNITVGDDMFTSDDMGYDDYHPVEKCNLTVGDNMIPSELQSPEHATTMMIRNLPVRIMQSQLAKELTTDGFNNTYDFLYVPCTIAARQGRGYGFVNFVTPETAEAFRMAWNNKIRFNAGNPGRKRVLNVAPSCVQGREANMAQWNRGKTKDIKNRHFRPMVKEPLSF